MQRYINVHFIYLLNNVHSYTSRPMIGLPCRLHVSSDKDLYSAYTVLMGFLRRLVIDFDVVVRNTTDISHFTLVFAAVVSPLELHLTTSELWFGQEQEGILP